MTLWLCPLVTVLPSRHSYLATRVCVCAIPDDLTSCLGVVTGELFAFGSNSCGQLGIGTQDERILTPVGVEALHGIRVKSVACGTEHTCATTEAGNTYAWGNTQNGRLGFGQCDEGVQWIPGRVVVLDADFTVYTCCGAASTAVLTDSGDVYTFGCGSHGALGRNVGSQKDAFLPGIVELPQPASRVACGGYHMMAITGAGKLHSWGMPPVLCAWGPAP